jgi:hypothetical protein
MIVAIAALLLQLQPSAAAPAAIKIAITPISKATSISTTLAPSIGSMTSAASTTSTGTTDANDPTPIHWNLDAVKFDTSSTNDKDAAKGTTFASLNNVSLSDAQKQGIATIRVPDPEPAKPIQIQPAETLHPSRAWLALSLVQSSAATFDAYSTRQAIGHGAVEGDPLLRPFAHSGALYGAIQVGPVVLDYVARHMQRSENNFFRRTWWVPQSLATAGFLVSGAHNMSVANSMKR